MNRTRITDILIVTALFLFSFHISHDYLATRGLAPFYQDRFESALGIACGKGFKSPSRRPPVLEFLRNYKNLDAEFDCDKIETVTPIPNSNFTNSHEYLVGSVGLYWKFFGIKWYNVTFLSATLFSLSIAALYIASRSFAHWFPSLSIALLFATSTSHLIFVQTLRDYSKAPFIIGILAISLYVISKPRRFAKLVSLSALAALLVYAGSKFRVDVLSATPVALLAILLSSPAFSLNQAGDKFRNGISSTGKLARSVATKGLCYAIVLFAVVALHHSPSSTSKSGLAGNLLYGLFQPIVKNIGVAPSEYTLGSIYNDSYNAGLVSAHSQRMIGYSVEPLSPEQASVTRHLIFNWVSTFPGDILTAALAGSIRITELGLIENYTRLVSANSVYGPLLQKLGFARLALSYFRFSNVTAGLLAISLACFALFLYRPKLGIFAAFLIFYFGAVASGQWAHRHVFHLETFFWLSLVILTVLAGYLFNSRGKFIKDSRKYLRLVFLRSALFVSLISVVFLLLAGGRFYQTYSTKDLIDTLSSSQRTVLSHDKLLSQDTPSSPKPTFSKDGKYIDLETLPWVGSNPDQPEKGDHVYLAIRVKAADETCHEGTTWIGLKYDAVSNYEDMSQSYAVPNEEGSGAVLYIPVFRSSQHAFKKLFVSRPSCLENVSAITSAVPFLATAVIRDRQRHLPPSAVRDFERLPIPLTYVDWDIGSCNRFLKVQVTGTEARKVVGQTFHLGPYRRGNMVTGSNKTQLNQGDCVFQVGDLATSIAYVGLVLEGKWTTGQSIGPGQFFSILKADKPGMHYVAIMYLADLPGSLELTLEKQ